MASKRIIKAVLLCCLYLDAMAKGKYIYKYLICFIEFILIYMYINAIASQRNFASFCLFIRKHSLKIDYFRHFPYVKLDIKSYY